MTTLKISYFGVCIVSKSLSAVFLNREETVVGLDKVVPFIIEVELKRAEGNYVKEADWKKFAVVDERIVTGRNPASGGIVAKEVLNC